MFIIIICNGDKLQQAQLKLTWNIIDNRKADKELDDSKKKKWKCKLLTINLTKQKQRKKKYTRK